MTVSLCVCVCMKNIYIYLNIYKIYIKEEWEEWGKTFSNNGNK